MLGVVVDDEVSDELFEPDEEPLVLPLLDDVSELLVDVDDEVPDVDEDDLPRLSFL